MTSDSGGDGVGNGGGDTNEGVHRWRGSEIQFSDEKLHQTNLI